MQLLLVAVTPLVFDASCELVNWWSLAATQKYKFEIMAQVAQIQSLIGQLTESLNEKQKFIDDLQKKLSQFDDAGGGSMQSLQHKLSDLQESMTTITEKRSEMTNAIADIKSNISQQKHEELSILNAIEETEKDHKSEMMSNLSDALSKLQQKKKENEDELLLKEAQLNAITSEQRQRDETDLGNLTRLLERADLLQRELNDPNYYQVEDKLRIYHAHNEAIEANEISEIRDELIEKRKQKHQNEQETIKTKMEELKTNADQLEQDLLSIAQKREQFEKETLSLEHSQIVKMELDEIGDLFSTDDVHKSNELQLERTTDESVAAVPPSDIVDEDADELIKNAHVDIHKIVQKIKRLERDLDRSVKRNKQQKPTKHSPKWAQLKRHSLTLRKQESALFQSMKQFLVQQIVTPFCDRYMLSAAELKDIQSAIIREEAGIEQDCKAMMRKQRGQELESIFGEIQREILDETIQDMIISSFSHLMAINMFSKRLTHQLMLNAVAGPNNESSDEMRDITRNCLRQLLVDRQKHHDRFTIRHQTTVIASSSPKKKKSEKKSSANSPKPKKKRRKSFFARGSKSKSEPDQSSSSKSLSSVETEEEIDIMEEKKKEYQRMEERDDVKILMSIQNTVAPFSSLKWMNKERKYWKEYINLTGGKNKLTKNDKISTTYSAVIASPDSQFFVIGTNRGDVLLFHVASKQIVSKTPDNTTCYGKIQQLLISDNNKEIVYLSSSGTVCVYKVDHDKLTNILLLSPEDIYVPPNSRDKYRKISKEEYDRHRPIFIAFHPCTLNNGMRPSILIALQNGTICKWNIIRTDRGNKRILNEYCQTQSEGFFSMFSKISSGNRGWITREMFQSHSSPVVFLGNIGKCSPNIISIDTKGLCCIWYYDAEYWTNFGWYVPRQKYMIDLDSFRKNVHSDPSEPAQKTLYDEANAMVDARKYERMVQGHLQQTHNFWRYKKRKNGDLIEHWYIPKSVSSEENWFKMESEPFTVDSLVYSALNDSLVRHVQQQYSQRRLKGQLLSCAMCSNHRDLILCAELTPYQSEDDENVSKLIQFRMLRCDQRGNGSGELAVSMDPFMVNVKKTSDSAEVIYDVSSVLVPPCSDYLYVLINGTLSVYSIYSSQKVVTINCSAMSSPFCVLPNHSAMLFANQTGDEKTKPCFWVNKIIDRNDMALSNTFSNALCFRKCSRVNRTEFGDRVQRRPFIDVNGHHPAIFKQIIQALIDQID